MPAPEEDVRIEEPTDEVFRCEGCGASADYDASARAVACAFCGSLMHREEVVDPVEQAGGFLPFAVDATRARAALGQWLDSLGWFRPADLRSQARLEDLRPLWWVAWVFDAQVLISWTADSNAGARRSRWAPHAGQCRMSFDDIAVSASRGLTDAEAYRLITSYDLGSAREAPDEVEGATIERYDVQRSQARARILAAIDALAADRVERERIPGTRFRKVKVVTLLRALETRRLAFPAWVMAYRYRERLYRVVLSGQNPGRLLGKAPYDRVKVALVIAGVAILALILALVVLTR